MKTNNILITGASRGIGSACAFLFAEKEPDCRLFLNCRSSIRDLERICARISDAGTDCIPLPGDVGDPKEVRAMFEKIRTYCPGIDILVNNAGISHIGLLSDMTDEEWDRVIRTNLSSVFHTCREAIPYMVSEKRGKILNVSSVWGRAGASCEAAYSASKAGVQGLTMALAKELAPSNIQVNAAALGVIDTSMNAHLTEAERRALAGEIPAGRFGTPQEAARLIFDLTHAPAYLTGQIVGLDGGWI